MKSYNIVITEPAEVDLRGIAMKDLMLLNESLN